MTTKVSGSVLANTAVTAGTYGGINVIPYFIVDAQGRLTAAANSTSTTSNIQFGSLGIGAAASGTSGRIDATSMVLSGSEQVSSLGVGTAASGTAGEIRATNEVTAYYSSDERLKENVETIENALQKLKQLRGVMFDWKDTVIENRGGEDGFFVRRHDTGVVAQEVEKVLPEVVAEREDGYKAVRYEKLAGLIIQSIIELSEQVEQLKNK